MMKRHLLLFSFVTMILLTNEAIVRKWKSRKEQCRLKMEHVLEQQFIGSLHECLVTCNNMPECESISWSSNVNCCLFSDINTVDDVRSSYVKWELAAGWVTYSLVKYPVTRIFNPDPDKVYMTFEEAVTACADHFGILASPDTLLQAAELDMDKCACCWLSNGEIGMSIPSSDACSSFSNVTGPAVVKCIGTKAGAWCKLN